MDAAWLFGMLLGWHALADYPLQGDFLATAKNHLNPAYGVPWYQALGAHAMIHGAGVMYLTGSLSLGLAEVILHAAIDHTKCTGSINVDVDQALHVACKALWVGLLIVWGAV